MKLEDLSPELQQKAKACTTAEELYALAKEQGLEIPDEDLDAIAGGFWCDEHEWGCPARDCGIYRM